MVTFILSPGHQSSVRAMSFKHLKSKHSRGTSRQGPWSGSARPRGPVSPRRRLPDGPLSPGEQSRGWRVSGALTEPELPHGSLCSKGPGCPRDGHLGWSRLPTLCSGLPEVVSRWLARSFTFRSMSVEAQGPQGRGMWMLERGWSVRAHRVVHVWPLLSFSAALLPSWPPSKVSFSQGNHWLGGEPGGGRPSPAAHLHPRYHR